MVSNNVENAVLNGILTVIDRSKQAQWSGTMTKLSSTLTRILGREMAKDLPRSPAVLRTVVNRVVNRLRSRGISVKFVRTPDHNRTRLVKFCR